MKNFPYFDVLFLFIFAGIFLLVSYFGYSKLIGQYSVIVTFIAYFIGKSIGRKELRKRQEKENLK